MISSLKNLNNILVLLLININIHANELESLSLTSAVESAISKDIWLQSNQHMQESLEAQSVVAASLPDPNISIGVANIAFDSFDFNQEPMTQFKVGLSQMFPRGQTRALKQQKIQELAASFPYQRKNRSMQLTVMVSHLWLEAYKAQQSIELINKDRELFEQLGEVAEASYTSTYGKTRQQDIIRSQLELTRLNDRLLVLNQKKLVSLEKLSEWLYANFYDVEPIKTGFSLSNTLTETDLQNDSISPQLNTTELSTYFSKHPMILAINQKITSLETNIKLTKQKYKPEFGINSSYGYRGNSPTSTSRSDLFSVGVSFNLPLFTKNKQDQEVKSAISETASIEAEKLLLLQNMLANYQQYTVQLKNLNQRQQLYEKQLLPQMHEQAEASLTAYTNDDGDFAEVVRSRIAVLNTELEELEIFIEKQKTIIQLNYLLTTDYQQILNPTKKHEGLK